MAEAERHILFPLPGNCKNSEADALVRDRPLVGFSVVAAD
jgi:hypothetical protein